MRVKHGIDFSLLECGDFLKHICSYRTKSVLHEVNKPKVILNNVAREFVANKHIDLHDFKINSREDLVALCSLLRDNRVETLRIIYLKNNKVVGWNAISSYLPDSNEIFKHKNHIPRKLNTIVYFCKSRMEKLGADSYLLVHNHPGNTSDASQADVIASYMLKDSLDGFIDSYIVTEDTIRGIVSHDLISLNDVQSSIKDKSLKGDSADSILSSVDTATSTLPDNSHFYMIYLDSQLIIREIDEMSNTDIRDINIERYFTNKAASIGAMFLVIITTNEYFYYDAGETLSMFVSDIIFVDEDGEVYSGSSEFSFAPRIPYGSVQRDKTKNI